jgi:hypothetical protein
MSAKSTTLPSRTAISSITTRSFFTAEGEWSVVQQGMSEETSMARRYQIEELSDAENRQANGFETRMAIGTAALADDEVS